jgi:transaldolase
VTVRLYLDSADRAEAEPLLRTGLFHGLTTNPTLLARSGVRTVELPELHAWATEAGAREVFLQSWGAGAAELVRHGAELRARGENVVVKAPATGPGVEAVARLAAEGCPTLLTAFYSAPQSLLAAAAGARYVAPYVGRMDDAGRDGIAETIAMSRALRATAAPTEILTASLRAPSALVHLAAEGVRCFTLSPALVARLLSDPLTERAAAEFERAMLVQ